MQSFPLLHHGVRTPLKEYFAFLEASSRRLRSALNSQREGRTLDLVITHCVRWLFPQPLLPHARCTEGNLVVTPQSTCHHGPRFFAYSWVSVATGENCSPCCNHNLRCWDDSRRKGFPPPRQVTSSGFAAVWTVSSQNVYHAFEWQGDTAIDLGALSPADENCSNAEAVSERGDIAVGDSETGNIDPVLGVRELRAVLW